MRHNDHEIDKLFREKLQQKLDADNHLFEQENDWSRLALCLSASGLVRTGVMSLGAKIFSYAAKTLLIGAMAFAPSIVSLNSGDDNLAINQQKNNLKNISENNSKSDFRNNIFNDFSDKNLADNLAKNNTSLSEKNNSNTENQLVVSKKETDLIAKDKSFIKTETTENQLVISKKETDLIAKDKSFIKTETTENQLVTGKDESFVKTQTTANDLIAKDKSFIKTETSVNQLVADKNESFVKTQTTANDKKTSEKTLKGLNNHNPTWNVGNGQTETTENQLVVGKENKKPSEKTLKGLNNHNPTWNVGNGQTETTDLIAKDRLFVQTRTTANEKTLSTSTRHFLTKTNLFENYFPTDFEVKNREIKRLEIVEIVKKERFAQKFQITLFSPIGTNLKAQKSKHYASLGILTSISAGVEGAEISGLANISTGKVEGLQVAGLANISRGETKGVQIAGLVNINKEKVQGLQVAGLANVSKNKVKGVQIATLGNVSNEQVDGAQVAVLANVSKKKVRGMQVATVVNATDTLVGAQIGLVNIAKKKARGLQLGLVNIVGENDKVLTIGLVNVVKKGGHNVVEMSTSEALYGNISLKTGVRKFYNIFAVGSRLTENSNKKAVLMAYGYGIGSEWDFKKKYNISGELMLYALSPDMKFNKNEKGILAQAKVMLGQKLSKNWGVFGGVTFNMLNSPSGINIIDKPFTVFNNFKIQDGNITSWTGLQVGARYFL